MPGDLGARPARPRRPDDRDRPGADRSRSARSRWAPRSPRSRRAASSRGSPTPTTAAAWSSVAHRRRPARCCAGGATRAPSSSRRALATGFTRRRSSSQLAAAAPLIERLAQSVCDGRPSSPGHAPTATSGWRCPTPPPAVFMSTLDGSIVHHLAAGDLPRHPPRPAGAGQHRLPAVDDHGLPAGAGGAGGHARPARRHVRPGAHLQPRLRGLHASPRSLLSFDPFTRRRRRAVADRLARRSRRSAARC